jgi:hypothetical protein
MQSVTWPLLLTTLAFSTSNCQLPVHFGFCSQQSQYSILSSNGWIVTCRYQDGCSACFVLICGEFIGLSTGGGRYLRHLPAVQARHAVKPEGREANRCAQEGHQGGGIALPSDWTWSLPHLWKWSHGTWFPTLLVCHICNHCMLSIIRLDMTELPDIWHWDMDMCSVLFTLCWKSEFLNYFMCSEQLPWWSPCFNPIGELHVRECDVCCKSSSVQLEQPLLMGIEDLFVPAK